MLRRVVLFAGIVAVPALLLLGFIAAAPAVAGDPCYHGYTIPPPSVGTDAQIKLVPCAFAPTITHVPVGTVVTWFNGPDFTHLVTGANQEWGSRDIEIAPGATVSYRFDKAGIYPYACALHRGMSGVIIVADVADAVAGGTTTTAPVSSADDARGIGPGVLAIGATSGVLIGAALAWMALRRRAAAAAPRRTD